MNCNEFLNRLKLSNLCNLFRFSWFWFFWVIFSVCSHNSQPYSGPDSTTWVLLYPCIYWMWVSADYWGT